MTWAANIPASALPTLTPVLRKELERKAYSGTFVASENVKHVWRKVLELGDSKLLVYAIQTER
jgi:hypothetical protein